MRSTLVVLILLITACSTPRTTPLPDLTSPAPDTPSPSLQPSTPTPSQSVQIGTPEKAQRTSSPVTPTVPATFEGEPLPIKTSHFFAASGICASCHSNLVDQSGADVSIGSDWSSTMMANAARDPYWQAAVSKEVIANPQFQEVIEDKCATCHMPMARTTSAIQGDAVPGFQDGYLNPMDPLHPIAMDGVSCTLCHQIEGKNLGEMDSFSGGYSIDTTRPPGERIIFGPYSTEEIQAQIMQSVSGYLPQQGDHVRDSELCATCHTLFTPTIDNNGQIVGQFPEQMAFLEWTNSEYKDQTPCQGCHMPEAQGSVVISSTGGNPQQPFYQHKFVGGNAYMLSILRAFGPEFGVTSSSDQFDTTLSLSRDQLRKNTARISIENIEISTERLITEILVTNQTGHKLPTGFPSRRAWIFFTVHDVNGNLVFESGSWSPDGSIVGNNNDDDAYEFEPHYEEITTPEQVQIYEAIFTDVDDRVSTQLLRGSTYIKDNRLLPSGFDKQNAGNNISVYGDALEDIDFQGGKDTILYVVGIEDYQGPYTVTAKLLYQSIGFRWADDLFVVNSVPVNQFLKYYNQVRNVPEDIASVTLEFGE